MTPKDAHNTDADSAMALAALLAEHAELYRLVEFRLGALDRRIPAASGVLTAFLGLVPVLPEETQVLALIAVPVSLVWLVRATINHARSLEDVLQAIELVEGEVNCLVGMRAMRFQSTHPSRDTGTGRRTGTESVTSVTTAAAVLLSMVLWLLYNASGLNTVSKAVGVATVIVVIGALLIALKGWMAYRARS